MSSNVGTDDLTILGSGQPLDLPNEGRKNLATPGGDQSEKAEAKLPHAFNYYSLRDTARRRLPRGLFEYIDRGAEDETSLVNNRRSLDNVRFQPRVLAGITSRSQQTELLGYTLKHPLIVAPTAAAGLVWHKGELGLARAAAAAGIPFCAAMESIISIEELAAATNGAIWLQLYVWRDHALTHELIGRAWSVGIETLVVTVDMAAIPKREYNSNNAFDVPIRPSLKGCWDITRHPKWLFCVLLRHMLTEGTPIHANYPTCFRRSIFTSRSSGRIGFDLSLSWRDIGELRKRWPGRLVLKGILDVEDARRAAEVGADAIVVSNHGGRNLDSAVSPVDVLPEIADAVGGRMVVLADSGVRRGSDVVKLLALGARAVLVGRAFLYGAASGGEAGAQSAIAMIGDEIDRTMALVGFRGVGEIKRSVLRTDFPLGRHAYHDALASGEETNKRESHSGDAND